MDTKKARSYVIQPQRNVLILKGDVVTEVLELLDQLMRKIGEIIKKEPPEPWQLFSFICASGASGPLAVFIGPGQQTTDEYRRFVSLLEKKGPSLLSFPSDMTSSEAWREIKGDLQKRFLEASENEHRSEAYIWNFHNADQVSNHIETGKQHEPLEKSFFKAGYVEEYPPCGYQNPRNPRFPWHGLTEAARTNKKHHNNRYFVSIRENAKDAQELQNESKDLELNVKHFAFVVHGPQGFDSDTHKEMLEAAASDLAQWLRDGQLLDKDEIGVPSEGPQVI